MLPDVAEVSPDEVNDSVDEPAPVSARFVKVATPPTAFTVVVPESVPAPVATLAVTDAVELVTRALFASRTCTTGCEGRIRPVEVALLGCVETASCVAGVGGVTKRLGAA